MASPFPTITSPPQAGAEVIVNQLGEAVEHVAVYAKAYLTTTGLIWGYYGGRWGGFPITAGTLTLTDATTNYVVVAVATGVISTSTTITNWNNATDYARAYKLTTAGGVVTVIEDHRGGPGGVYGGAGGGGGGGGGGLSVTTKGDLQGFSTVAARVPVGANYTQLMPDSAATLGVKYVLQKAVPLSYFGTLANDGTTDDAAVLATAIASGVRHIDARGLNLAILTQVSLAANVVIDFAGTAISTTGSTITTFKADTIDDWALLGPFTITGAGSTTGTAKGVHVVGCNRWQVDKYTAKNIKGHGFYVQPGTPSGTLRADQGVVTGYSAFGCYHAWEDSPGDGAEYCLVTNMRAVGSGDFAVKTCAGNIVWTSVNCVDNTGDGFTMVGGTNHAHGIVTGLQSNHNGTYNLNLSGVVNGETFVGCHFYEKLLLLDGCNAITFVGGAIDISGAHTITVNSGTGSGKCRMLGVYFPGGYGATAIAGTDPTSLTFKECSGPGSPGNMDIETQQKSAAYTFTIDDEAVDHPAADTTARTFTIPANSSVPFPIGKVLSGANGNGAGVITLAITTDTMRLAGVGTTGSRTIAANGNWAAKKIAATEWQVSGNGIT